MYNPSTFQENRPDVLHQFIRDVGLGTLVTGGKAGLDATHLPFVASITEGAATLRGHVAKANGQWRQFAENPNVLVVFLGPQAYVTPQWYPSKREHGRVVPTWNYATVHAHGTARAVHDEAWLRENVSQLTAQHESRFAHPWSLEDAPAEFISKMLGGIVGIEITVTRMEGKWKLSQNREDRDRAGVLDGLSESDDGNARATAALMNGN